MYRVLVVDDEEMIAEGLALLIGRIVPECKVIAVAYDGTEGYEIAVEEKPDIILTDVRMYEMDGIEMIRRIKAAGLESRYIILSGYAEFEYAKQGIILGVEDYITKPVEEEELYKTFEKVCMSIRQEKQNICQMEELKETVGEYSQSVKEYYMRDILEGQFFPENHLQLQQMEFFRNQSFLCAVFEYNNGEDEKEKEAIREIFQKQCQMHIEKQYDVEILTGKEKGQWIMVLGSSKQTELRKVKNFMGKIRFYTQEQGNGTVCTGIGLWHKRIEGIRKSYVEAMCALNYKMINGPESSISYDEIRNIDSKPARIPEKEVQELERCINEMDNEGCKKVIEKIFRKVNADEALSPENLQVLTINLILFGIRKMPFMQLQINEYLGKNILSLENITRFNTMEQLKNWIINVICGMNDLMMEQNLPEKRDVVKEVREYINKNFSQDISLADISEKFFINPYYFSQLFKKKTGETYQSYLTGIRIARAKKLLKETDLKIYEISEMIGYKDVNHFSRVFEKREGMKPSSYRKAHME
ncbi:MAG: response regulator [Eubacteriales bacterium]|nr:response regulator [Eubacteriales bacterium]